ncbi:MAG: hypothetical protein DM484_05465 [Candidatus Methylumidiphilus alinenensis]|uniref:Uncharacterized protein n=1 Tax=Candidatus Methylumidiphilus alinenensis TaxID=2202197 RepID=A0A2W4TKQ7_9GAMM|nr:MAG: hypothetical protein DM484_05465 [Candidatus Methylumidiphilus alinenensis]
MKIYHTHRAILVLESPWELDNQDANRSSVIPFINGVAKLAGDTEVFHANFYDKNSFEKALECLCKTTFENTTVYIAAHGYKKKAGNVKISDVLRLIGDKSKKYNITGLMLGACFVGENTITMEVYIEGTNLKWCAGYSSSTYWLPGTLIDCSILSRMSELELDDFEDRDTLIYSLADAISPFSNLFNIGLDYNEKPVSLEDSMQFVVQPSGKGYKAKKVNEDVLKIWHSLQCSKAQ